MSHRYSFSYRARFLITPCSSGPNFRPELFLILLLQPANRLFRLGRRRRGLARQRRPDNPAVLVEFHAQAEAHLGQYIFDFIERLAAEVFRLQHFVLALLDEFTNGLNIRVLQAVVRANGKLQFFHRAVQVFEARVIGDFRWQLGHFRGLFKVDEDAHVILDQLGRESNRVLRSDGAVGPHFNHQFFVVGHLAETSGFDRVVDLAHWRVNGVHRDITDRQILVVVAVRGHVTAAILGAHLDLQLAAFADRGDVYALIEHRKVRILFDLRRRHRAGILHINVNRLRQIGVQLDRNLLNIEDNVRGVLDDTGNRRKFVQHSFDFHRGDGCAFNRTEQRASQRVPYRGAPAALKRLRGKPPVLFGQRLQLGCQTLWLLKTLPHRVPSFWLPSSSAAQNLLLRREPAGLKPSRYRD